MEIRQRLEPSASSADSQLALIAVLGFSVAQFFIAVLAVVFCTRVLGFSPSRAVSDSPVKALLPSLLYFSLAVIGVLVFRRFLRTDLWRRGPAFSDWSPRTLLAAFGFGLMPVALHTLYGLVFFDAHISARPALEPSALVPLFLFTLVCLINAVTEELAFRTTPLALLVGVRPLAAFLVPVTVFVLGHFLEPERAFTAWRAVELLSASLLFFLVALDHGLAPAALAHTALNLAYSLTDGTWQAGALIKVSWTGSHEAWLVGDCAAIWAATVAYLVYSLRGKRRRARTRDLTLSLTPI